MALPQVYECAVIGVPHETWGEAVKGLIVVRQGESLTEEEVIAHWQKKLGGVKAPKSVEFLPEIPKTPAGKIDRKKLRAPYWQGAKRAVRVHCKSAHGKEAVRHTHLFLISSCLSARL